MSNRVFLVDASNQAYRGYYAMQADLRAPDGFPTRALYGFVRILISLVKKYQPNHILVVFDKGKSFRVKLSPDYKGHRPEKPEDLQQQWPFLAPLAEAFGFPTFEKELGFEADDIIGTLAKRFGAENAEVMIVSNDKDFAQLVDQNISLLSPIQDQILGRNEVIEKWGVEPTQIVDLLTLVGDKSDNIAGIPGVGAKKAAGYLKRFGDWRSVIRNADVIGGKTGQKIAAAADTVELANQLVQIRLDVPVDIQLHQTAIRAMDKPVLAKFLYKFGFHRMITELGLEGSASQLDQSGYQCITTKEQLNQVLNDIRKSQKVSLDLETTSLNPRNAQIVGVSLCWQKNSAVYIPVAHSNGNNVTEALEFLRPMFADPQIQKIGQNLKFDTKVLLVNGFQLHGIVGDTMLSDYLLYVGQKHNLDSLALRHLQHRTVSYDEITKDYDGQFADVPIEVAAKYAAEDAHVAYLVDQHLDVSPVASLLQDIEIPLVPILAEMELTGIRVDVSKLNELSVDLERQITSLTERIHAEAKQEFNLNSTKQFAKILYEERGLKPIKKLKTGYSTDSQTLALLQERYDEPLLKLMQEYRELAKLKSTYVDALPKYVEDDGRIHTSLHQAVTETGRLSSSDPNLQNIPIRTPAGRKIRSCFIPDPNHVFISVDYSQLELRVLAHFCKSGPLVDAFVHDLDIHEQTGLELAGGQLFYQPDHRRAAKAINYGLIYGMSAFRLSKELKIPQKQAQAYIDKYFLRYPEVRKYMLSSIQSASEKGYACTLTGRRRPIYGLKAKKKMDRESAERIAMNTPIQGTAADIVKIAMIKVHQQLKSRFSSAKLLLQIHDELLIEAPSDQAKAIQQMVISEMESISLLDTPLKVSSGVGDNWDEAH